MFNDIKFHSTNFFFTMFILLFKHSIIFSHFLVQFMNKQLIAVAQFIFSVGSGFAFGFYGIELLVGDLDFGFRLLLGVICSLVIALAEIYFLAKIIAELDLEGIVKTDDEQSPKHSVARDVDDTGQPGLKEKLHQD